MTAPPSPPAPHTPPVPVRTPRHHEITGWGSVLLSVRTAALVALLGGCGVALWSVGRVTPGTVLPPSGPLFERLDRAEPALVLLTLLRPVALVLVGYLLAVTVVGAMAARTRRRLLVRLWCTITTIGVRRLVERGIGSGLALSAIVSVGAPAGSVGALASTGPETDPPVTMVLIEEAPGEDAPAPVASTPAASPDPADNPPAEGDAAATAPPTTTDSSPEPDVPPVPPATDADEVPTMTRLDERPHADGAAGTADPVPDPGRSAPDEPADPPADPPADSHAATWTVQPGDHLWHVAEVAWHRATGHPPTTLQTSAYLARIIDANQQTLVLADNPDLIFPGQVFALPPMR